MKKQGNAIITAALLVGTAVSGLAVADPPAAAPATAPAAAPEAPKTPVAALADTLTAWGITETGYIAASYYGSNGYPSNIHQFDFKHNTFQLDEIGLQLAYQPKSGFGGVIDIIAGEDGRVLNAAEDNTHSSAADHGMFEVRQAFLQYAVGAATIMAGKFVTLAGAEVINPSLNTNFSRSLLFFDSEPLTHTGIRATYAISDTVTVTGGVNNGWNITSTDYGSKTGEAGIAWTPNKTFSLAAQGYFGKAEAFDAEKTLIDVVATYNATSSLTFILNFDWNQQKFKPDTISSASWNGAAFYVNYAINDQWRVSARVEYLDDKDGFVTPVKQTLKEGTLTFGYSPVKSFELRLEGRYDKAQDPTFYKTVAALDAATPDSDNLTGFAVQGVYKF